MKGNFKYFIILIFIILAIISIYIIKNPKTENTQEKEVFKVNKITLYTSANAIPEEEIKENWEIDIYQYTDIAIYIEKMENKIIDSIYIDNINITKQPELGIANIYKKSLEDFAKPMNLDNVENTIQYQVSKEEGAEFLEDCSKPIIISYINNVEKDYIIPNTGEQLEYNESILKRAKILTSELEAHISFEINIITEENIKYTCLVQLDIPVEELANGNKTIEKVENINFIRKDMN